MAYVRGPSAPKADRERSGRRASRMGLVLLVLSLLFFSVNFAQEWLVSHQIQQQATQLQKEINDRHRLNAMLQSQLAYYSSAQYIVPAARSLGLARPGDHLAMIQQEPARVRTVRVYRPAAPSESIFARILQAIFQ